MLKSSLKGNQRLLALGLVFAVGAMSAALVALGNPGNMGLCGACFLRDIAGSLGMFTGGGPRIYRPEIFGLFLGAALWVALRGRFEARSGSHAAARWFFGVWMGIGALVVLGCPFRMLQRVGGGDLNAVVALLGFLPGVGVGLFFERRGYRVGKTAVVHHGVGLLGLATMTLIFALFAFGKLQGPGPSVTGAPAHAIWWAALGIAVVAGAILSATRFCAISAARQVFGGERLMLVAALTMILGYGVVALATGNFVSGFDGQPVAHSDHLWSALAMFLIGLCGCLAGGCPVRQVVMVGEGNGDALCSVVGIAMGGALAHSLGIAASLQGTTELGRVAVAVGIALALAYGFYASSRSGA